MSKIFGIKAPYKTRMEMIMKIINIHLLLFPPRENLHKLEKEALAFYILYGYDEDTSRDIETSLSKEIKPGYARSINSTLEKKGFLIKDVYNKHMRHLSKDMQKYRDNFTKANRLLPIIFEQNAE